MTQATKSIYDAIVAAAKQDELVVVETDEYAREMVEDFVSATQQIEPDQLLQIEPYQTFLIKAIGAEPDECGRGERGGLLSLLLRPRDVEDSPQPLMKFCPRCDQWRSVFGEQTVCSLCSTPCEITQDAMSKLPEGCNSGLMGM